MNSEDRNAISRFIHDVISWLKTRLKGEKVSLKIVKLENRFAAVLRNVDNTNAQKNNTTNDGDVQYSISYTTDNKPVVVVNDDIISNAINNKDKISIVKWYLGRFKKVPIKSQTISFIRDTKNEYTNSRYSQWLSRNNPQVFNDKMRVAGHPQDIIYATTNYINEGLKHQRKDNIIDFARGDIFLDVSGRKYAAKVVIGFTNKGVCELHDIVDIIPTNFEYKKIESASMLIDTNNVSSRSDAPSLEPTISQIDIESQEHYTQESENYSSQEQNDGGILYSFGDIDKGNKKRDNISRANKQGELINEFYYALDKSEWNLFYRKIAESGFLEKTDVGDRVAIAIGGKLLIADRQLRGTDAHDFQIVAAYQEENGDLYVTNEIADIINESEDIYDQSRIESTIIRLGKKIDEASIFNRYDREHREFVNNTFKRTNGSRSTTTDGGHRTRTFGEGVSSSTEQNTQRINAGLNDSAFSMPENDGMEYSFEDDVVDKTSSLAERVRLGEISQTEYLNELQQLMDEATEKYGAIPKGENPKVDVTVPKQVSDKRNTRRKNNKKES